MLSESAVIERKPVRRLSETEFGKELGPIYRTLNANKNLADGLEKSKLDILNFLDAGTFTVFQNVLNGKELKSFYRAGPLSDFRDLNMIIPFSPTTPVGYVALNHRHILIEDINDHEKLINIHPQLVCQERFSDRPGQPAVKSMIVVPIEEDILYGVIQVLSLGNREFNKQDVTKVRLIAKILAKFFKASIDRVKGPYDYLVQLGRLTSDQLDEIKKSAFQNNRRISKILLEDYDIEPDVIGSSLEAFYQVPYMKYDPVIKPAARIFSSRSCAA